MKKSILAFLFFILSITGCTQEQQNKLGRGIQNWTGVNGVLDVYNGGKIMQRFIKIDKLTTAKGTDDGKVRPYIYGYGYIDLNKNYKVDKGEKKVYFRLSEYSTQYLFYENPKE